VTQLHIHNATLIDGTGADARPGVSIAIEDGRIARIAHAQSLKAERDAVVIDATGRFLLPGLTDAHLHFGATESDGRATRPLAAYALKVAAFIEETLDQGFTTVRDAGGLDAAWAVVVERGLLRGPRILPSGSFLSQTGGHGDWHLPHVDSLEGLGIMGTGIAGLIAGPVICDGPDAVRKAARDQLRRGATQIKVMASGGAASPTDPIDATQFTIAELQAAVEEAAVRGTYVLAHAYHPKSISNCLEAGVRSIEHGNLLDEATAQRMATEGAFLVPTLITYQVLSERGEELGLSKIAHDKINYVAKSGEESVRIAMAAGVRIGSGSDLLGPPMAEKARELVLQASVMGAMGAIVAATKTNAELFGMADRIGTVAEGKQADLIVVDGDPLTDIGVLADASRVRVVLKEGTVMKNLDGAFPSTGGQAVIRTRSA